MKALSFFCKSVILENITFGHKEKELNFNSFFLSGLLELNLIHMLDQLQNHIVFISATPIKDVYLDELDEFKNIPYVSLIWDKRRYESVRVTWQDRIQV